MDKIKNLTCIECPVGCYITVETDGEKVVSVTGNGCNRGKLYAQNEVICPMRVVTSTVRTADGKMLPVKTDKPVKKQNIFNVMGKIRGFIAPAQVKEGDVLIENVSDGANLVATDSLE